MKNTGKKFARFLAALLILCQALMLFSCSAPSAENDADDKKTQDDSNGGDDYFWGGDTDGDLDIGEPSLDGGDYSEDESGVYPFYPGDSSGENYTDIIENNFISAALQNKSYFSIDANSASYPNLRSLIKHGYTIPKNAVRVEEMLNYFDYGYVTPEDDSILALTSSVFDTPYGDTKLLTIGLASKEIELSNVSSNLVFLIDTSGSMYSNDKLPLVQKAFKTLLQTLGENDRISIVTYAGSQTVALDGAYGHEKSKISAVIDDLSASGSTAGSSGIQTAYEIAQKHFIENGNNRVILMTDGDFNVGITRTEDLKAFISQKRESGVYFSVFGVGRGNLNSSIMETLALSGNGTYSYIDSVSEAERALSSAVGATMFTLAKDVKAGVVFNPEYIDSYRLVGYENKLMSEEDFNDENKDAGEIGSGYTLTVVYEIKLTDKPLSDGGELASVTVRYKPSELVSEDVDRELVLPVGISAYRDPASESDSFIASVIEFALILRDSEYKQNADLTSLIERLDSLDLTGDKAEFRDLVKTYRQKCAS